MIDVPPCLNVGFFRIARKNSFLSTYRVQVGAVLAKRRPISFGHNKVKTHPTFANPEKHLKASIHAEIACLIKADIKDIIGSSIYVYREDKEGNPKLSRPCNMCMKNLKEFGVKEIFYSIEHYPYWASEKI